MNTSHDRPATRSGARLTRRELARCGTGLVLTALASSRPALAGHSTDIAGTLPALELSMIRVSDGKQVSAADYQGKIVLLCFGYTSCPDVCPTMLLNITLALKQLAAAADQVRVLFVTVDPDRDTPDVLNRYTGAFAPQIAGLRGSADQLAALAKRYRVAYSVEPATKDHAYEVAHSSAVYVFDRNGDARLLFSGMAVANPDIDGFAHDLREVIDQPAHRSFWHRFLSYL